jgi:predicted DNA-binding transcriptional regulator AlpA
MDQGNFPPSILISERSVAWKILDVQRWIDTRISLSELA